jgi:hypothetical protein
MFLRAIKALFTEEEDTRGLSLFNSINKQARNESLLEGVEKGYVSLEEATKQILNLKD